MRYPLMPLLLDGLEVFDEDEEIPANHFFTDRATTTHLPKTLAPDGHLPIAMGREDGPSINNGGNFGDREAPSTPLGNAREIGRWRAEGRSSGAIAASCHPMAGATIARKVLLPRAYCCSRNGRWLLRHRQGHPQKCPSQDHYTETIPL